jgi:aryl carrier-like protein
LRVALRERLPEYMIPTGWVTLEKLPLNGNGKLDRKALPAPEDRAKSQIASPPMNAIELELAAIWCEVLGRSEIDASDDIFALGADSIQIFAITARANRHGLRILAKDVLQKRTIRAVARSLSEKSVDAGRRLTKAPVSRLVSARERTGTDWR